MKSLFVKLRVLFIGLLILGNAEVWGADWRHYATTDKGQFYYDKESVTLPTKGVVRVWVRIIKNDDLKKAWQEKQGDYLKSVREGTSGRKEIPKEEIDKLYAEYLETSAKIRKEVLKYYSGPVMKMLEEIKCADKMIHIISGIEYDEKGNAKNVFSDSNAEWEHIIPETTSQELYEILCPQKVK
jgi:hypothetical protein